MEKSIHLAEIYLNLLKYLLTKKCSQIKYITITKKDIVYVCIHKYMIYIHNQFYIHTFRLSFYS